MDIRNCLDFTMNQCFVFHVGYSKCMSTWLQDLFKGHPSISYCHRTQFFQTYDSTFDRGMSWYARQFIGHGSVYLESDEHLLLPEIDPILWINKSNLSAIKDVLDRINKSVARKKVIFVYRSQVDMILSRYIQFVRSGGKLSFDEFFDATFCDGRFNDYYDYRYSEVIKLMVSLFGSDNVLAINIDDFKLNRDKVVFDLSNFIGVPIDEKYLPTDRVNVSPSYYAVKAQRAFNRLMVKRKKTHNQRAQTYFGYYAWKIPMKLIEKVDSVLVKNKRRYNLISDEQVQRIQEAYEEDNIKLMDMSGTDLRRHEKWFKNE